MKTRKKPYKEFKSDIYPFTLFIGNKMTTEEINKYFYPADDKYNYFEQNTNCNANTFEVVERKTKKYGVLVNFFNKKVSVMGHEAFHVVEFIVDYTGMTYQYKIGNEHLAYLIGWVLEQMQKK